MAARPGVPRAKTSAVTKCAAAFDRRIRSPHRAAATPGALLASAASRAGRPCPPRPSSGPSCSSPVTKALVEIWKGPDARRVVPSPSPGLVSGWPPARLPRGGRVERG